MKEISRRPAVPRKDRARSKVEEEKGMFYKDANDTWGVISKKKISIIVMSRWLESKKAHEGTHPQHPCPSPTKIAYISPGELDFEMEKNSRKLIFFQESCLKVLRVQTDESLSSWWQPCCLRC